ncbi:hypothetical protein VST24_12600, partial [Pseudomonas aeruginosa]
MSPPQRLRAGLLRGCLRLLFRGLVRPPMPVALQRGVLQDGAQQLATELSKD